MRENAMKNQRGLLLVFVAVAVVVAAASAAENNGAANLSESLSSRPRQHEIIDKKQQQQQQQDKEQTKSHFFLRKSTHQSTHNNNNQRSLGTSSYCGNGWQNAFDTCDRPCPSQKDEECGPGLYCYNYVGCTPPEDEQPEPEPMSDNNNDNSGNSVVNPWEGQYDNQAASSNTYNSNPNPAPNNNSNPSPSNNDNNNNYMPSYIASLPVRPSEPITPPPFTLPKPTPNLKSNPTNNYCGYGWESAQNECFHACPSGKDDECPNGRTCHSWMTCTPATIDPATYNVCGKNWAHAASTCQTRCFLGNDDDCPPGETCFGGVSDCDSKLPELTAEDVGLAEKSYTQEEIAQLLDEEIEREQNEAKMENKNNWWCGSSWTNMLETCSKRCQTDDDCKPNAWTEASCFRTTGGPNNCQTPGIPVRQALPPGSRWCGSSWNNMLETCKQKCEADEDCGSGETCWEAPDTCQWVGVPVKEKSNPSSLWCGVDYGDAMTSCHKACPGEGDDECPEGMSCFAGSECTEEGVAVVREGYRCGVSWNDASDKCGVECQSNGDCEGDGEECFAEVVCASELEANNADMSSGMFCGVTWESTGKSCNQGCEVDEDCPNGHWCYWVECENDDASANNMMKEPTTEATVASCNAEVWQCSNGQFVGRAAQLGCDFYPCPEESNNENDGGGDTGGEVAAAKQDLTSSSTSGGTEEYVDLSGWGSTSLTYECTPNTPSGTCGFCQGDCNSDDDCQTGLMCFSRGQGEMTSVPGCVSGGDGDKPGMDYCYSPFPPATTTTTTTTTTTSTTTTTISTKVVSDNFANAGMIMSVGNLDYARECSADAPCSACQGDCDNEAHCANGLECFSRGVGSVELVPGCLGLGIAGMDYCYDPNAPIVRPPTPSPTTGGCSAEVSVCPDGRTIVYRDPANDCDFSPCPPPPAAAAALKPAPPPPPTSAPSPSTSSPTFDASTYYCGYSLNQVNRNCGYAKPCPSGFDNQCDGLEVCIHDTDCGSIIAETVTITTATSTAVLEATSSPISEADLCDDLCLDVLPSEFCPMNLNLPNCLEVGMGEVCEADGECATDDQLNNCDTYDIYARVRCGFDTMSQGQIMRGTASPTPGPSNAPTPLPTASPVTEEPTDLPTTAKPTPSPTKITLAPTSNVQNVELAGGTPEGTVSSSSISIADAIASATANAEATTGGLSSLSPDPSQPPVTENQFNAASTVAFDPPLMTENQNSASATTMAFDQNPNEGFAYDRSPGGGGGEVSQDKYSIATPSEPASTISTTGIDEENEPSAEVGSSDWYTSVYGEPSTTADAEENNNDGWNFDSYFRGPSTRNSAAALNAAKWVGFGIVMINGFLY